MRTTLAALGILFLVSDGLSAYHPNRHNYRKYSDGSGFGNEQIDEKKSCALQASSYHSMAPDPFEERSVSRTDRTVDIPINYHVIYLEGDSIYMNVTVDNQQSEHCMWDIRDYDNNTFLLYPGFGFDYPSHSYSLGGVLPPGNYALFLYDEYGTGGVSATVTTSDGTVLASVGMGTWSYYTFLDFTAPEGSKIDGLVSDEIIEAQTAVINNVYNSFGYSFYTASIDSAVNAGWYYATDSHKFDTDQWDNDDQYLAMAEVMTVDVPSSVNFFWTGATFTSGLGVYPWSFPEDSASHGLFCGNYTYPGSYGTFSEGYTGVHEVGHYFGLYHTFENGCTSPGDEVDDTPYQADANFGCPSSNYSCGSYDDMGNHMDYIDDYCQNHFTQGQIDRMDWALEMYRPTLLQNTDYEGPVWHVATTGSDSTGDGSEENPFTSIQLGLDSANDNDTVLVDNGMYLENIIWPSTSGIKLLGSGEETCIVDGDSVASVFRFGQDLGGIINANTVISGFTIQNGYAQGDWPNDIGGGIYCYESSPTLSNVTIMNNSASERGGGIGFLYSSPSLTDVTVTSNFVITSNSVSYGGGIYCWYSSPSLREVTIANNTASKGGGIYCWNSSPNLTDVTITNNSAFSNITYSTGGGLHCYRESKPILTNVTITNNSASKGGGIFCHYLSSPSLVNSILWNDSPEEIYLYETADSNSVMIAFSDIQGGLAGIFSSDEDTVYWGEGNMDADPLFIDAENGDYALQESSPCIDAGTSFFVWGGDTLVNMYENEYFGNAPDMGAFEFSSFAGIGDDILPTEFALHPPYPNPFNPTTTIRFSVGNTDRYSLHVYDITGRVADVLVNGKMESGQHEIQWNAANHASGVYFAELVYRNQRQIQKMILLK